MTGNDLCADSRALSEGREMESYSEAAYSDAYRVCWRAEALAGVQYPQKGRKALLRVPSEWTACLLMEKAGVPLRLIEQVMIVDQKSLGRRLLIVKALMMFAPYAARIENLMKDMPRYGAVQPPVLKPAREAACAVQIG
jgi:hypothetical protein